MPVVAQAGDDAATAVARTYRDFGRLEAQGRSAAYEALAESVAGDSALVSFIASLPPPKRQPNLLFAAARYLLGAPPAIGPLRELASQSRAELTQVILARRTQTNEPARCAVLLPVLAVPLARPLLRTVRTFNEPRQLNLVLKGTARLALIFGLLFGVGLAIESLVG